MDTVAFILINIGGLVFAIALVIAALKGRGPKN